MTSRPNNLLLAAALAALALAAGCGKPDPADRYRAPDEITDFSQLFGRNCSGCHGMDGQLGPAPPLNDPLFQRIVSDAQLTAIIAHGRANTLMPAFANRQGGPLTDEQVRILVAGIRREWAPEASGPEVDLPVYEVAADDPAGLLGAQAAAGEPWFASACAGCHGGGTGEKQAGSLAERALGGLISDQLLRRVIITGRPDLGMPDYAALGRQSPLGRPFTSEEISQLAAYVRSLQTDSQNGEQTDKQAAGAPAASE